jgi:hypothetical protein
MTDSSRDCLPETASLIAASEGLPQPVRAVLFDGRVREIEAQNRRHYIELGELLVAMEEGELWRHLRDPQTNQPFTSFDRWLGDAAPVSRSTGYLAKRAVKELSEVPREELLKVPQCNAEILRLLPGKQKADPEIVRQAQVLNEEAFRGYIGREVPEAHIEGRRTMRFRFDQSAAEEVELAIKAFAALHECELRETAVEGITAAWLDSPCEVEGHTGTNREAYAALRGLR